MDKKTFELIYLQLEKSNIKAISKEYEIREEVLSAILNLKLVRQSKEVHRIFQRDPKLIQGRWGSGESILTISSKSGLSPVLVARFIMKEQGYTQKGAKWFLKKPNEIKDKRLKKEVREAVEKDFLYSPEAHILQRERAKLGEEILGSWLAERGVVLNKNNDTNKTPDFIFHEPLFLDGVKTFWADSKAIFADEKEHMRYISKQFAEYLKIFGPGVVVYWYGYAGNLFEVEPRIIVKDFSFISDPKIGKLFELIR